MQGIDFVVKDPDWETVAEYNAEAVSAQSRVIDAMVAADRAKDAAACVRNAVAADAMRKKIADVQAVAYEREKAAAGEFSALQASAHRLTSEVNELRAASGYLTGKLRETEKKLAEYEEATPKILRKIEELEAMVAAEASTKAAAYSEVTHSSASSRPPAPERWVEPHESDQAAPKVVLSGGIYPHNEPANEGEARLKAAGKVYWGRVAQPTALAIAEAAHFGGHVDDLPPYKRPESPDCEVKLDGETVARFTGKHEKADAPPTNGKGCND